MKVAIVLCLAMCACAHAGVLPVATHLVRTPAFDSAVITSDRVGGNFAYSTKEAHAYAAVSPIVQQVVSPVAVSYTAQPIAYPQPQQFVYAQPQPFVYAQPQPLYVQQTIPVAHPGVAVIGVDHGHLQGAPIVAAAPAPAPAPVPAPAPEAPVAPAEASPQVESDDSVSIDSA